MSTPVLGQAVSRKICLPAGSQTIAASAIIHSCGALTLGTSLCNRRNAKRCRRPVQIIYPSPKIARLIGYRGTAYPLSAPQRPSTPPGTPAAATADGRTKNFDPRGAVSSHETIEQLALRPLARRRHGFAKRLPGERRRRAPRRRLEPAEPRRNSRGSWPRRPSPPKPALRPIEIRAAGEEERRRARVVEPETDEEYTASEDWRRDCRAVAVLGQGSFGRVHLVTFQGGKFALKSVAVA